MLVIKQLVYRIAGLTKWNFATVGHRFVWKRYNPESDTWQIREMTDDEFDRASLEWSVR